VLRAGEDVYLLAPANVGEAGVLQRPFPLCFQQSTGNSVTPEVYIRFGIVRYDLVHHHVAELYAPTRL